MKISILHILFLFIFISNDIFSQLVSHKYGELIVQLRNDVNLQDFERNFKIQANRELVPLRLLSKSANIWLVTFDFDRVNQYQLLEEVKKSSEVVTAQFNHRIEERATIPNDNRFIEQWMWLNTSQSGGTVGADISLTQAWDFTTGGLTSSGDTIVVAVLDSGVDLDHLDLWPNVWKNKDEIIGDGIDNDGNGYIDDIFGWNFSTESNEVNNNRDHGTAVAGMIGAVGNNNFGVVGVNWDVKVMNLIRRGVFEDAVIEGYDYALQQRIKYNESNGEIGAYVVAVNTSFGIDRGQPADAPIWCSFYDLMGQHGILNCGATSNSPINIDQDGDLPTACPSDFLISVAATDHNDNRNFSGFGPISIDVAAPGQDVLTLSNNGGFRSQTGTSFASPTVAGLVALLYSLPCPGLEQLAKENPGEFAEIIRDAIFQGVDVLPNLASDTKYSGRINALRSMQILANFCSTCPTVVTSDILSLTDESGTISWETFGTSTDQTNIQYRVQGETTWIDIIDVTSPYTFSNLDIDQTYEYRFINICQGEESDPSIIFEFSTLGGCGLINIFSVDSINGSEYVLSWADNYNLAYEIQIREVGNNEWITYLTADTSLVIEDLLICQDYEVRLKPFCPGEMTDFFESFNFTTYGCDKCSENEYCLPEIEDNFGEFISDITLNDWTFSTDVVGSFYQSNAYVITRLSIASEYIITMTPGFLDEIYDENLKAWIDFNGDGIFLDDELILDSEMPTQTAVTDTFIVPIGSQLGITKIRFSLFDDSPDLGPCDDLEYGFVRDFCIEIGNPLCSTVETIDTSEMTISSATIKWTSNEEFTIGYTYRYRELGTTEWSEEVATIFTTARLFGLKECTEYEFQVRNICQFDVSEYITDLIFKTECTTSTQSIVNTKLNLNIYPNPFYESFNIEFESKSLENTRIQLFNINGNLIKKVDLGDLPDGISNYKIENLFIPSGVYILTIANDNTIVATKKIIKI